MYQIPAALRHRNAKLAKVIIGEYQGICLKLSKGRSHDILMLGGDIIPWDQIKGQSDQ